MGWYPGKILSNLTKRRTETQQFPFLPPEVPTFTERTLTGVTELKFIQTAPGADKGIFYFLPTPRVGYSIGVDEDGTVEIPGSVIDHIEGDNYEIRIVFNRPVTVRLRNGYKNIPFNEWLVKNVTVY
jgi:hypothetical protein